MNTLDRLPMRRTDLVEYFLDREARVSCNDGVDWVCQSAGSQLTKVHGLGKM